ncbi:hypothetical protein [Streptomyces sp. NPDC006879]|uniref:hypothetical protein n=1 Tax=Streptomyces sp. NPDC006879 TaxID=3364767 RepID=UPI0036B793B9
MFDRMIEEGFLAREGGNFSQTAAGQCEAESICEAWVQWLGEQPEKDRGRPRSAELRAAMDGIAKRPLAEDFGEGTFTPDALRPAGSGAR